MPQTRRRTTALTAQLDREWDECYSRARIDLGELGVGTGGEWVARMRAPSADGDHTVLRALLERAGTGDAHAQRTVLALMMPKVMVFARTSVRSVTGADAVAVAVGAAWETIRTFRVTSGLRNARGSLVLAILRTILAAEPPAREIPCDPALLPEPAEITSEEVVDADVQVAGVLQWAMTAGVLDAEQVRLLVRLDLLGLDCRELAEQMSVAYDTVRKRAFRARRRLATAARDQIGRAEQPLPAAPPGLRQGPAPFEVRAVDLSVGWS
ncbi:hypothetical protein [Microbacterium sp. No. 7]|uniref:hypothetical protein n=1 Tax=Microbacterium sp. No. 7 TaxID=1714373 RepID=UPI0006CFABD3|nr:hypothetical protein [Microbacterium sp. No. 7]ALJ21430.1 hypothetical protein AOA12_16620 [Microbacterium sp. No. 7]